jgi:hypothetical protein
LIQFRPQLGKLRAKIARDVLAFARQLEVGPQVLERAGQLVILFQGFFKAAARLQRLWGGFLILPEIGAGYLLFDGVKFAAPGGCVKENS